MSDEEVLKMYNEMVEYYRDRLPNFEHYPKQFAYLVKLWKYYKSKENGDNNDEKRTLSIT